MLVCNNTKCYKHNLSISFSVRYIGLIIANKLQTWMNDFNSLRLSQIIDMYYSDEDITLNNENIKVCDRKKAFSYAIPKTFLNEQVL